MNIKITIGITLYILCALATLRMLFISLVEDDGLSPEEAKFRICEGWFRALLTGLCWPLFAVPAILEWAFRRTADLLFRYKK